MAAELPSDHVDRSGDGDLDLDSESSWLDEMSLDSDESSDDGQLMEDNDDGAVIETLQEPAGDRGRTGRKVTPEPQEKHLRSEAKSNAGDTDDGYIKWAPKASPENSAPCARYAVYADGSLQPVIKYLTVVAQPGSDNINIHRLGFFSSDEFVKLHPLKLPTGRWNTAILFLRRIRGRLRYRATYEQQQPLLRMNERVVWPESEKPRIEYVELEPWHDCPMGLDAHSEIYPCFHDSFRSGEGMLAKFWQTPACVPRGLETEVMAYRACAGKDITPEFLAHVTENGRVIGFLMEYIDGARRPFRKDEMDLCRNAVRRFHKLTGWHRAYQQNCKENFLIRGEKVWLINLQKAQSPESVKNRPNGWAKEVLEDEFDAWWHY